MNRFKDSYGKSFCSLSVIYPCFFLLNVLALCLFYLLCNTHNENIHDQGGIFFCSRALYLFSFVLIVLALPLVLTVQHTQEIIHAPGGIQTRNPRKRSAADPRLRPLGYWDRLKRISDLPACVLRQPTALPRALENALSC